MSDRATIRYPYRTREGRLRWGRWTGSRAAAFNAGAEALGGLTAHALPLPITQTSLTAGRVVEEGFTQTLAGSWVYIDAVTKTRWRATTDDVAMLGAALIALPEPSERTWRHQDLADIAEEQGPLGKLAAAAIGEADRHRPTFDELFDAWAGNTPTRRQLTPKPEDPT